MKKRWSKILALLALAWFSWLLLRITLQYWPIRHDVAFLRIKQQYLGIDHWRFSFFLHVFTSMIPLLGGFTQFFPKLHRCGVHRTVGRIYAVTVCFITGPASLVMAFYANGGLPSRIAFCLLAVGWIATTALGWKAATRKHWRAHRDWMIRSYALTLSAITLRIWKYVLANTLGLPPMDLYRMVAWLGFVPNLLIAEWLIRRKLKD